MTFDHGLCLFDKNIKMCLMSKLYQKLKKQTYHQMEKSFNSEIILPLISSRLSHKPTERKKPSFRGHLTETVFFL